jgi:hypothetical protein
MVSKMSMFELAARAIDSECSTVTHETDDDRRQASFRRLR